MAMGQQSFGSQKKYFDHNSDCQWNKLDRFRELIRLNQIAFLGEYC